MATHSSILAWKILWTEEPGRLQPMGSQRVRQDWVTNAYTVDINHIVVQLLSCVQLFATPSTAACQASLSFTVSQSLLKLMSIESVMPSNHLILCGPLLLLPSVFPSIRVFSNESALHIRWPKFWSFSFSISPSNEYLGLTGLIFLLSKGFSRVFYSTTVWRYQFFDAQPFFLWFLKILYAFIWLIWVLFSACKIFSCCI